MAGLEKSYVYFVTMLPVLLGCGGPGGSGNRPSEAQAMRAWCAAISSSMDGLANDANMLRCLIQVKDIHFLFFFLYTNVY